MGFATVAMSLANQGLQQPIMSNENVSAPPLPTPKTSKPVSEALLNEKVGILSSQGQARP